MGDSTKRYIAVDLGASCGKVVLASAASGSVTAETVHSFTVPSVRLGGHVFWDIYAAYAEVLKGLSLVGERKLPVESLGVSAWSTGLVCVASDGSMLGLPRIYPDVLSAGIHSKLFKRMDRRELYETAGVNIIDSHAALQLFALRREKSAALENAKYIFSIADAFVYLLTGKRVSGFPSLSAAGLIDRNSGKLSRDIASAAKVRPRRFPSAVQTGTRPARLTEDASRATGLSRIAVTVVPTSLASAVAALPMTSSDTSAPAASGSSQAGQSHVSDSSSGFAFLISDAGCVMGVRTSSPVVNDQTFELDFSNEAGIGGANLLLKRIAGTDLLQRCLSQWRREGRDYGPEDIARMAREGAETSAQLDPEDPALLAVPDAPAAIARYCSLRSMAAPADDAAVVRLIYSSVAEKFGDTFVKLQSVTPFRIKSLNVAGEISLDPVLCQLISDECAVPVLAGPADAAVLGNILVQSGLSCQALPSPGPLVYTPGL